MLERNTVVFCPNIGLLSTCVLSLIPLLRPFSWQHFLMPVLPDTQDWLDLLDNPTPFVVGIQVGSLDWSVHCGCLLLSWNSSLSLSAACSSHLAPRSLCFGLCIWLWAAACMHALSSPALGQ